MDAIHSGLELHRYESLHDLLGDAQWWSIFYKSLHPDEIEDRATLIRHFGCHEVSFFRATIDDRVVGLAQIQTLRRIPSVFLGYLAVSEDCRGMGIGEYIVKHAYSYGRSQLRSDGHQCLGLVTEADRVSTRFDTPANANNRRRLDFYGRMGLKPLAIDYIQPPLANGREVPMTLLFRPEPSNLRLHPGFAREIAHCIYDEEYIALNGLPTQLLQNYL